MVDMASGMIVLGELLFFVSFLGELLEVLTYQQLITDPPL